MANSDFREDPHAALVPTQALANGAAMSRRIAVLGGGISGLASAFHLGRAGKVTIYEADSQLGGLGSPFIYNGFSFERFYHCLLPSDAALLAILAELGLSERIVWRETGMGFMVANRAYAMNRAIDLLRFRPLAFTDRVRLGWMGLRARASAGDALDEITVRDWIVGLAGKNVYEQLWRPLLEAKLGDRAGEIPALWLSSRIRREKGNNQEVKGFVPGGYRAIVAALEARLRENGAEVRLGSPVESLDWDEGKIVVKSRGTSERYDSVIVALPLVEYERLAAKLEPATQQRLPKLDYQGVINSVFLLRRRLQKHYWLPIMDSGAISQGLVETSNLVPPEQTGGLHVVYLLNYTHRTSPLYRKTDAELLDLYKRDFVALYPEAKDSIEAQFVFKAPFVEPIWPLRYGSMRPAVERIPGKLYLASTAQVYPKINAWNSCCEVAREMADAFGARAKAAESRPVTPAAART
jgi:protoporphyrinogen oxidase